MKIIYSHTDFDGVISASLLSIALKIDYLRFVSNNNIWYEKFTGEEVIADLPCPWNCKLWFDHHESNLNEMKLRGIDIENLPGKFELAKSCSRIIFNYFNRIKFPKYFENIVHETDIIDSMDYNSIDEWQKETDIKILSETTQFLNYEDYKSFINYLIFLAKILREKSPEELVNTIEIKKRYEIAKKEKKDSIKIMEKCCSFHSLDYTKEIIIIDTSEAKIPPRIDKNLAYILKPDSNCVLLINSIFKNGTKTNSLKFSAGINFTKKELIERKDLSKIFEKLNIGGGHKSAAGGIVHCKSKEEKIKLKNIIIERFVKEWKTQ